jgi:hypothetical protein
MITAGRIAAHPRPGATVGGAPTTARIPSTP